MRRYKSSGLFFVFIALILTCLFAGPAFSQEQQITLFTEIELKPGMNYEFENYIKDEVIPALKEGGTQEMSAWKSAVLGTGSNYVFSTSVKNFAEFDEPHPFVKALGPYGAQALSGKLAKFAISIRSFTMSGVPELEIAPPEGYVPKIGLQVKATVNPGRDKDYENNTKIITEIFKKINAKGFYAARVGIGGNPNQYYFLVLFDSFSDMDPFGAAFEKEISETEMPSESGILDHMEYATFSYDPELSIQMSAQ